MADRQRFRMDVSVRIVAVDPQHGHPTTGGSLEVREEAYLTVDSFMDVAAVLGHFHELTQAMKVDPHAHPEWRSVRG